MTDRGIYLDNNATTRIDPQVTAAMTGCLSEGFANPASQHAAGRIARRELEQARHQIGRLLGTRDEGPRPDRVIFTSGGTEANNLALRGIAAAVRERTAANRIIVSTIEHPSISETATHLSRLGFDIQRLPVESEGVVVIDRLHDLLTTPTACVSVMLANNETGVIQPIAEIAAICRAFYVPLHCDAVQVAGKVPLSFSELGVQAMTVTAHKFHGPRGIGVLLASDELEIQPVITGGSQQLGTRPGTESVALAVGMSHALATCTRQMERRRAHMERLRDQFENALLTALPTVIIHGRAAERLPHTTNVAFPGVDRQVMLLALDHEGVYCATGSACTSGSSEPSHVLIAMGCDETLVESSLRFSLSADTTDEEIELAVQIIVATFRRLVGVSAK